MRVIKWDILEISNKINEFIVKNGISRRNFGLFVKLID